MRGKNLGPGLCDYIGVIFQRGRCKWFGEMRGRDGKRSVSLSSFHCDSEDKKGGKRMYRFSK